MWGRHDAGLSAGQDAPIRAATVRERWSCGKALPNARGSDWALVSSSAGQRDGQQEGALRAAPRVGGVEGLVEGMGSGAAAAATDGDGGNLQIHGHVGIGGAFVEHLLDLQGAG